MCWCDAAAIQLFLNVYIALSALFLRWIHVGVSWYCICWSSMKPYHMLDAFLSSRCSLTLTLTIYFKLEPYSITWLGNFPCTNSCSYHYSNTYTTYHQYSTYVAYTTSKFSKQQRVIPENLFKDEVFLSIIEDSPISSQE